VTAEIDVRRRDTGNGTHRGLHQRLDLPRSTQRRKRNLTAKGLAIAVEGPGSIAFDGAEVIATKNNFRNRPWVRNVDFVIQSCCVREGLIRIAQWRRSKRRRGEGGRGGPIRRQRRQRRRRSRCEADIFLLLLILFFIIFKRLRGLNPHLQESVVDGGSPWDEGFRKWSRNIALVTILLFYVHDLYFQDGARVS